MRGIRSLVFMIFFLGIGQIAMAQEWYIELTVSEPVGDPLTVRLGVHGEATNEVDRSLGEVEWPPLPPQGIFDVRLKTPAGRLLLMDLRSSAVTDHLFSLIFVRSDLVQAVRIAWDRYGLPEGYEFRLRDVDGGDLFDLDMKLVGEYWIDQSEINQAQIQVRKIGNNAPVLVTNEVLTVDEGEIGTIGTRLLQVTDAEPAAGELTYMVGTPPGSGDLKLGSAVLSSGGTFTQAEVDGGQLSYTHDGSETTSDSFTFTVSDGAGGSLAETAFGIAITMWHVELTVSEPVGDPLTVRLGVHGEATNEVDRSLGEVEWPPLPPQGVFDVRLKTPAGRLLLMDLRSSAVTDHLFSLIFVRSDLVQAVRIAWDRYGLPEGYEFRLRDVDGGDLFDLDMKLVGEYWIDQSEINQAQIQVRKNNAPVLDASASPILTAIEEDNTSSNGNTVSEIVVDGSVSDMDGTLVEAIAVVGVDDTHGTWQYSMDGGSNWSVFSGTMGQVVDLSSAARLLGSDHRVRFVPVPDWNGTVSDGLTIRAWDQSSGIVGETANASVGGETTAFSSATDGVSIGVTPVNDAPTLSDIGDQSIVEDGSTGVLLLTVGDVETAASELTVSAVSDNQTLVPDENLVLGGSEGSRTLTVTPVMNGSGSATVTVSVSDGELSSSDGFVLTVKAVNDAPSFVKGMDQTVREDAGAQMVANWATEIVAGPPNESGQVVTFEVNVSDKSLFSEQPAIDSSGMLTYTPAPDANGSATVTVVLADDGGTTDGGDDTSDLQTFSIAVSAVNDAPRFIKRADPDQMVLDNAETQTVANWATGISAGPANELMQAVTFAVSVRHPLLFSEQPAISPSGTLTYTPARLVSSASASDTLTVVLLDNGGTANGGRDSSDVQTFTITVLRSNTPPTLVTNAGLSINTHSTDTGIINRDRLQVTDAEQVAGELTYTMITAPVNGTVMLGSTALSSGDTLTQANVNDNNLSYIYTGSSSEASDSFTFTVSDRDGGSIETTTFAISMYYKPRDNIQARFSASPAAPDTVPAGVPVHFTDQSLSNKPIWEWSWDFGDGNKSNAQNPSHPYPTEGTVFSVSLTVRGDAGAATETKRNFIIVGPPPPPVVPDFTVTPRKGPPPLTVHIENKSQNAGTCAWEISGPSNYLQTYTRTTTDSLDPPPFPIKGSYYIKLKAYKIGSSTEYSIKIDTVIVEPNVIASFTTLPDTVLVGREVQFTDTSKPPEEITSWSWEFGDGDTSSVQNPSHPYKATEGYPVKLTVMWKGGMTDTAEDTIHVFDPLVASFEILPDKVLVGKKVQFTDTSKPSEGITSWSWDFGDGDTSNIRHPSHAYTKDRDYEVKLTIAGPGGNSMAVDTVHVIPPVDVSIEGPLTALVGAEVQFAGTVQAGQVHKWSWVFPDGIPRLSGSQNPQVSFTAPGEKIVILSVVGQTEDDTKTVRKSIQIWMPVQAAFSAPERVEVGKEVIFIGRSTGDIAGRVWDFGDGTPTVENQLSVRHIFTRAETFPVSLTVTGRGPDDVSTVTQQVRAIAPPQITTPITALPALEDNDIVVDLTGKGQGTAPLTWTLPQVLEGGRRLTAVSAVQGNQVTFVPKPDSSGSVRVRFTLTDADGGTVSQEVVLVWTPVPDPPTIALGSPGAGATQVPSPLALTWKGRDPDPGDVLRYDVYLGTNAGALAPVAVGQTFDSYLTDVLPAETIYFWKVVITDGTTPVDSGERSFTTAADTRKPVVVRGPSAVGITETGATLQWSTDEKSDSRVWVSLTEAGLASVASIILDAPVSTAGVLAHAVAITGLESGTEYFYRVASQDAASNESDPKSGRFTTLLAPDVTLPKILTDPIVVGVTGPRVQGAGNARATIQWTTDEASTSEVRVSLTEAGLAGAAPVIDGNLVRDHAVGLTGLLGGQEYFYEVVSRDAATPANVSAVKRGRFRTPAGPDVTPPQILTGPGVVGITAATQNPETPQLNLDAQATIRWTTDEASSSVVEYGETEALGQFQQLTALEREHAVVLGGLKGDQGYQYRVYSVDASNNKSAAKSGRFRTLATADVIPPRILTGPAISGLTAVADPADPTRAVASATVRWTTNEASDSRVSYSYTGTDGNPVSGSVALSEAVLSHVVILTNLPAETQVAYTVGSTDASGSLSTAKEGQFTTPKRPDTTPPQVLTGPIALAVTDVSARIEWTTDEDADALVEYQLTSLVEEGDDEVRVAQNAARVRKQSIALTNLKPDREYRYTVTASDQNDLATVRSGLSFKTRKVPDVTPPQILTGPVVVTVLQDQAVIEWTTDELSDSEVSFQRTDGSTPEAVVSLPEDVLRHSVRLTNLVSQDDLDSPGWAGAEFRYTVRSTDASDNGPTEKEGTFKTRAVVDDKPPQILTGPVVRGLTAVTDPATGATVASATIRWTTDEASDSYLEYSYTDPDLGEEVARVIQLADPVVDHAIAQTNLPGSPTDPTLPAVTVRFRVQSTDVAAVPNTSAPKSGSFTTPRAADIFPPQILTGPVPLAIADSSARIEWSTDEDADARVDFGIASLGALDQVVQRAERRRKQSIALTNLEPATEYLYQVTATDVAGLSTVKTSRRFTTKATPDVAPPVITAGPAVVTVLQDQAVIEWSTDELSDSQVIFQEGTPTGQGRKAGFTYGPETVVTDAEDVLKHSVRLTDLTVQSGTGTTYQYWVRSTDAAGNGPAASAKKTFTTLAAADADPPQITRAPVALKLTDESATIVWSADEPADGFVEYASEADYLLTGEYNRLSGNEQHTLKHEVELTNLKDILANPTGGYRFRVRSTDPAGNGPTYSGDARFTLLADPDVAPPVIVSRPVVTARTVDEEVDPPTATATLQWVTDEQADSRVRYGLDAGYGQEVVSSEDVLTHTVTLSNLAPNTEYHYQVESVDASDNPPVTGVDRTFTTLAFKDNFKPVIGGVGARNVTKASATIEWVTNEPATSVVDFGPNASNFGLGHVERGELVKQHSVELANLTPGSKYFFQVTSVDASGNAASEPTRGNLNFDTVRENKKIDQTPPQFLEGPVIFPSAEQAVIRWRTDEVADYQVEIGSNPELTQERQTYSSNSLEESNAVTLTNLQRGTFYYYRLTVSDGPRIPGTKEQNYRTVGTAGGGAKRAKIAQPPGGAGSFVTLPEPDTQWPVLLSQPTVVAKTTNSLTIEWTTDEISDSFVDFGSGAELVQNQGSPDIVNRHRVTLTNLTPDEKYTYQVGSTDPSGNGATRSAKLVASTDLERDLAPPQITAGPQLIWLTDQSATIEWTTNELSTSVVDYGIGVLDERRADPELVTRHRVTLTNMDPATAYTYQVGSVDGSLNGPTTSAQLTFTTEAEPDLASPEIVGGPDLVARSDQSAIIAWQTDEMANSAIRYGVVETALDQEIGSGENVLEHQLTLTNLTPATTYYYQVSSVDRSNNGPTESAVLELVTNADADLIPPVSPVDVVSQPGSEAAWVSWTANTEVDLGGYNVYRKAADEDNYELVATSLIEPRYLDKALSNGVTYAYQVTAMDNTLPPNESVPSDPVESTPAAGNVAGAPVAKAAIGGLEASSLTLGNATPVAGRETLTYTFEVSSDSTFSDVLAGAGLIAEGPGGETKWTFVQPLDEGVEYWWRARANDGLFYGLWSPADSFLVEVGTRPPGDFDEDGDVDFDDFFLFADNFGRGAGEVGYDVIFDLSNNSIIDFDDFFIFADNFGRSLTSKTTVAAAREGDLRPELKVVSIDRRYATLALEVASPLALQGYGVVLRLPSGVQIQSSVQDARVRAEEGVQQLEGVLRRTPEQVWYGSYRLQGGPADGAARVFEATFELPPEAIGGEVSVEELWAVDAQGQSMRLLGGPRVKLLPQVFALAHPYPNPFNPSVSLDYSLPEASAVKLVVYNVLGQRIRTLVDEVQSAGFYQAVWNGMDDRGVEMASGIYLVRFEAGSFVRNRKILMVK